MALNVLEQELLADVTRQLRATAHVLTPTSRKLFNFVSVCAQYRKHRIEH